MMQNDARRFRVGARPNKKKVYPDGTVQHAVGFGIAVGYWPCMKGPYIEIAIGSKRFSVWHGLLPDSDPNWMYVQVRE